MNRLEKILSYLDGKMTQEELSEFKDQLKVDPDLMDELDIHRITDEVNQPNNEENFRIKLAEAYDDFENERSDSSINESPQRYKRVKLWLVIGVAAASLALLIFLHPFSLSQDEIFLKYYEPYNSDFSSRSISNDIQANPNPDHAISLYLAGNYEECLEELESFTSGKLSNSLVCNFYIGLAAIENEKYNLAVKSFELVLREDFSFLHEHSQWYLSLVYQKMGKYDLARENLMDLKLQRSIYSKKSNVILQSLPK